MLFIKVQKNKSLSIDQQLSNYPAEATCSQKSPHFAIDFGSYNAVRKAGAGSEGASR